mmetsp:Transcript_15386/g.46446  ORF Transcript_15386/g.46446 Transcript_15386/m.46446 type:complete len:512 (-) Transcript_15386:1735-3270(-)
MGSSLMISSFKSLHRPLLRALPEGCGRPIASRAAPSRAGLAAVVWGEAGASGDGEEGSNASVRRVETARAVGVRGDSLWPAGKCRGSISGMVWRRALVGLSSSAVFDGGSSRAWLRLLPLAEKARLRPPRLPVDVRPGAAFSASGRPDASGVRVQSLSPRLAELRMLQVANRPARPVTAAAACTSLQLRLLGLDAGSLGGAAVPNTGRPLADDVLRPLLLTCIALPVWRRAASDAGCWVNTAGGRGDGASAREGIAAAAAAASRASCSSASCIHSAGRGGSAPPSSSSDTSDSAMLLDCVRGGRRRVAGGRPSEGPPLPMLSLRSWRLSRRMGKGPASLSAMLPLVQLAFEPASDSASDSVSDDSSRSSSSAELPLLSAAPFPTTPMKPSRRGGRSGCVAASTAARAFIHRRSREDGSSSMPTIGRLMALPISDRLSPAAAPACSSAVDTCRIRPHSGRSAGSSRASISQSARASRAAMYASSSASKGIIACGQCSHSKYGGSRASGRQKP